MIVERLDFRKLHGDIAGEVIVPGDPAYDAARRVWNGMIDKRPLAIARCTSLDDVQAAMTFAASNGVSVAVRGGGHNIAGNATCDNGLVIDLSPMKSIEVNEDRRRVRAGGGVHWGEFDREAQKHGLATTGGLMPAPPAQRRIDTSLPLKRLAEQAFAGPPGRRCILYVEA